MHSGIEQVVGARTPKTAPVDRAEKTAIDLLPTPTSGALHSPVLSPQSATHPVLVVDDEPEVAGAFARILRAQGMNVVVALSGAQARALIRSNRFDFILCDLFMPDFDGLEVLTAAVEADPTCPVAVITGGASVEAAEEALEKGAWRYLQKPVSPDELVAVVRVGIQLRRLRGSAIARVAPQQQTLGLVNGQVGQWLDSALSKLWMAYQPIVHKTGELFGYEALVRSDEPLLSRPDLLFSAAMRLGRTRELDAMIHSQIAKDIPKADPGVHFFVNVDPSRTLSDDRFLSGADPLAEFAHRIVLEVTENAPLSLIQDLNVKLAACRRQGYRLAVDDLGSGYSALSAFLLLEPDVVKLDMSLVRGIDQSATKQKLVECMTETCSELGVAVVCEGVETQSEYEALLKIRPDLLQGYHFGRPARPFPKVIS